MGQHVYISSSRNESTSNQILKLRSLALLICLPLNEADSGKVKYRDRQIDILVVPGYKQEDSSPLLCVCVCVCLKMLFIITLYRILHSD